MLRDYYFFRSQNNVPRVRRTGEREEKLTRAIIKRFTQLCSTASVSKGTFHVERNHFT